MKLTKTFPSSATALSRIQKRGSALVIALVVLTIVASMGAVFLQLTTATTRRQVAEGENLRAFYLAEAGLAESFQALRIGRTGQVGSETDPAVYGDGLVWVDATETVDGQVRLRSTALVGRGRATLAFVVEPVEVPLGFFSDEDLIVDEVVLIDGFNSEEATYEEETFDQEVVEEVIVEEDDGLAQLQAYAQWAVGIMGRETLLGYLSSNKIPTKQKADNATALDADQAEEFVSLLPELRAAYNAGTLFPAVDVVPIDADGVLLVGTGGVDYVSGVEGSPAGDPLTDPSTSTDGSPTETDPLDPTGGTTTTVVTEVHTDSGGMLSSNGNIEFTLTGEPVEIFGDVVPGAEGAVTGLEEVLITGDTDPRPTPVELEPVRVPSVSMAAPVRHDGLLPLVVSPGTSGHERFEVVADAELILRGPATIVIGDLILEPGAALTLDTRDGDVALYVTGSMDLQPGSVATTTSDFPDELSIQVAEIATGMDGAPVKLEATSQFHGTIYAPQTDVRVGGAFEMYGGIVAKRLEIGAGARLHFDNARYEGSPVPRVVSWRIVEIPASVRGWRVNPYRVLGVQPGTLDAVAEAHDLESVRLTIEYLDAGGVLQSFDGTEDQFDWSWVEEVVALNRDATRVQEDPSSVDPVDPEAPEEPVDLARTDVTDTISRYPMEMNEKDLVDLLIPKLPLTSSEWEQIDAAGIAGGQYDRLKQEDTAAGGTGGL